MGSAATPQGRPAASQVPSSEPATLLASSRPPPTDTTLCEVPQGRVPAGSQSTSEVPPTSGVTMRPVKGPVWGVHEDRPPPRAVLTLPPPHGGLWVTCP